MSPTKRACLHYECIRYFTRLPESVSTSSPQFSNSLRSHANKVSAWLPVNQPTVTMTGSAQESPCVTNGDEPPNPFRAKVLLKTREHFGLLHLPASLAGKFFRPLRENQRGLTGCVYETCCEKFHSADCGRRGSDIKEIAGREIAYGSRQYKLDCACFIEGSLKVLPGRCQHN